MRPCDNAYQNLLMSGHALRDALAAEQEAHARSKRDPYGLLTPCPCCEAGCVGPCTLCNERKEVTRIAAFLWRRGEVTAAHMVENEVMP